MVHIHSSLIWMIFFVLLLNIQYSSSGYLTRRWYSNIRHAARRDVVVTATAKVLIPDEQDNKQNKNFIKPTLATSVVRRRKRKRRTVRALYKELLKRKAKTEVTGKRRALPYDNPHPQVNTLKALKTKVDNNINKQTIPKKAAVVVSKNNVASINTNNNNDPPTAASDSAPDNSNNNNAPAAVNSAPAAVNSAPAANSHNNNNQAANTNNAVQANNVVQANTENTGVANGNTGNTNMAASNTEDDSAIDTDDDPETNFDNDSKDDDSDDADDEEDTPNPTDSTDDEVAADSGPTDAPDAASAAVEDTPDHEKLVSAPKVKVAKEGTSNGDGGNIDTSQVNEAAQEPNLDFDDDEAAEDSSLSEDSNDDSDDLSPTDTTEGERKTFITDTANTNNGHKREVSLSNSQSDDQYAELLTLEHDINSIAGDLANKRQNIPDIKRA